MASTKLFRVVFIVTFAMASGFLNAKDNSKDNAKINAEMLRAALGNKLMLDFRYFCEDGEIDSTRCRRPMTQLPPQISDLLTRYNIGGVVLFSENLSHRQQIKSLTDDLQKYSNQTARTLPLLIAVDQEGGRVARLPRNAFLSYSGNMAIGATYSTFGDKFAYDVGLRLGEDLQSVGINTNFAPNVDVNSNPDNPVINIRSYSDDPNVVAKLAAATIKGFSHSQITTTLKHFPGHGDTSVDSHSGLPLVEKPKRSLLATELKPFASLVNAGFSDLIMTAHIQFPKLDASSLTTKQNKQIIKPATFSRVIINDLLKQELGFQGLVISDALDMGAISQHFTNNMAVEHAFSAGVDIALMPLAIRNYKDFKKLEDLLEHLDVAVSSGRLSATEIMSSSQKITELRKNKRRSPNPVSNETKALNNEFAEQLAQSSLVSIFNRQTKANSGFFETDDSVLVVMPDTGKCKAWENTLKELKQTIADNHQCFAITEYQDLMALKDQTFDHVVIGHIVPKQASYEMVQTTKEEKRAYGKLTLAEIQSRHNSLLTHFKTAENKSTLLLMRMPYQLAPLLSQLDTAVASFNYVTYLDQNKKVINDSIRAFIKSSLMKKPFTGKLPIKADSVCPRSLVLCATLHND